MVCVRYSRVQIVFQIQITVKNVIEIQNTKYFSKWTKYKLHVMYFKYVFQLLVFQIRHNSGCQASVTLVLDPESDLGSANEVRWYWSTEMCYRVPWVPSENVETCVLDIGTLPWFRTGYLPWGRERKWAYFCPKRSKQHQTHAKCRKSQRLLYVDVAG